MSKTQEIDKSAEVDLRLQVLTLALETARLTGAVQKDAKFDATFFSRFDVVLNGLDNMEARRHVNRMCLSAGVPLVESGTAGYLGQARGGACHPAHPA